MSSYKQGRLIEHFVSASTARTAASMVGVNKTTSAYSYHRLREIIAYELEQESYEIFDGEIEVDESYFGVGVKANEADVLVWWQPEPPSFLGRFAHLVEIVQNQPHEKEAARKRYKFYKSHGYPVDSHIIGKKC